MDSITTDIFRTEEDDVRIEVEEENGHCFTETVFLSRPGVVRQGADVDTVRMLVKTHVKRLEEKVTNRAARTRIALQQNISVTIPGRRQTTARVTELTPNKVTFCWTLEGVEAMTYSDEVLAKDAALAFKDGTGDVLCGCSAHYGTGVDFPKGTAGAIWFLRPGYPNPQSAATKFEIERYGDHYWSRLAYRVMLEAQQAVGRNIRGPRDKGVCFLMSQKFSDFVYAGLPEWLKPAYRRGMMLDECLDDAEELLAEGSVV